MDEATLNKYLEKMQRDIFKQIELSVDTVVSKKLEIEKKASHLDKVEKLKVEPEEKNFIKLDEEIKNKRFKNEAAVLEKIVELATIEGGEDLKKKMIEIQLIAKKRIFLLEMVERIGWPVAIAYQELYPRDIMMEPAKLNSAIEYAEALERTSRKKKKVSGKGKPGYPPKREFTPPKDGGGERKKGGSNGQYGACFKCGGDGHWAKDCPTRNK